MKKGRSMSEVNAVLLARPESAVPPGGASISQGASGVESSAGMLLRNARQAQGLGLDALAASLKVSVNKLQALEQNQFDLLPDAAFVRALAASVCRLLKLDPAPVLQRLPPIDAFKKTVQNRGINTPFHTREAAVGSPSRMQFSRPAVLFGLALLLGALVLIFLPFIQQEFAKYKLEGRGVVPKIELLEPVSTLAPGKNYLLNASGALPLMMAIGQADAIQVRVRGQAFDLGAVAKNNVARFEVK